MAESEPPIREGAPRFEHQTVREHTAVVRIQGELDIGSADALRDALDRAEATRPDVIRLDAGDVNFLDSTALGVILACAHRLSNHGAAAVHMMAAAAWNHATFYREGTSYLEGTPRE